MKILVDDYRVQVVLTREEAERLHGALSGAIYGFTPEPTLEFLADDLQQELGKQGIRWED